MDEILRSLLNQLESIGQSHEELYDSEVRQQIGNAIMVGFIRNRTDYVLPDEYGMLSVDGNQAVREAVGSFLAAANGAAEKLGIVRFADRLAAVQDRDVRSVGGYDYEEFIGHTPPEFYDDLGNVIRTS